MAAPEEGLCRAVRSSARAWLAGCGGADDAELVVSELFTNCIRYGSGGTCSLEINHRGGMVLGMMLQLDTGQGADLEVPEANAEELAELAALANGAVGSSELVSGRGLAIVGDVTAWWQPVNLRFGTAVHWALLCGCETA
ncbi:ATP-binding protein [Actinocorallia lasiicapitis]